jgi:hypothetical protein
MYEAFRPGTCSEDAPKHRTQGAADCADVNPDQLRQETHVSTCCPPSLVAEIVEVDKGPRLIVTLDESCRCLDQAAEDGTQKCDDVTPGGSDVGGATS